MRRNVRALAVTFAMSTGFITAPALAVFSSISPIRRITQESGSGRSGALQIELVAGACTPAGGTPGPFFVKPDDGQVSALTSVALAAYLSGKTVRLGHSNCIVSSIQIF